MKILCLYPGMDIRVNDNAYALLYLKKMGVDLTVICSKACSLKIEEKSTEYENMNGIPIHRIYEDFAEQISCSIKNYARVYRIAREFRPSLIFCWQQKNMLIAKQLKKDLGIPILLGVEQVKNPSILLGRRRYYLGLKPLSPIVANLYWRWLSKNAEAIITSFIGDVKYLKELSRFGTLIYYVPWCNQIPEELEIKGEKDKERGIYIGSLSKGKNTDEFAVTIPMILKHTPVKEFLIVGPEFRTNIVKKLKAQYGEHVKYIESLPRIDALKLIRDSFFSYTPIEFGGWGFIGDSWGVKTPLITTHNEYALRNRVDSLIVKDLTKIHLSINELYENPVLYKDLQEGGLNRYQRDHTAQSVGDKFLKIFQSVVSQ